MTEAEIIARPGSMFDILSTGAANLVLRAATLLAKLALVVYLGRYLSLYDLGLYGILVTSVAVAIQVAGMDFYVFNAREILGSGPARQAVLVRDQLALHGVTYVVVLPLLVVVFMAGILPWSLLVWFYFLVVLEHLSQETARLLTTVGRPVLANLVEFVRMGAWVAVAVAVGMRSEAFRTLGSVVRLWTAGVFVSLVVGWSGLRQWQWRATLQVRPDVRWWIRGLRVAMPFVAGTIALKVVELSNRYILQISRGEEQVGIFTFHQSLAGLVTTAVVTGLVMVVYPRLLHAHIRGDIESYRRLWRILGAGTLLGSVAACAVLLPAFPMLTALMRKTEFSETRSTFWILLGAAFLHNLSMVPHYSLYARHFDRDLMWAAVAAAAVNVLLNLMLIPRLGVTGAAWATVMAFAVLCVAKWLAVAVRSRHEVWNSPEERVAA